jgi:hypothetical protein
VGLRTDFHQPSAYRCNMKPKITDKNKEKLMASIVREMNLPRLTESVRNGMSVQTPPLAIDHA